MWRATFEKNIKETASPTVTHRAVLESQSWYLQP